MRFYVPVNLLAADYSHVLQGRGVTLYAHTADNCLRLYQQPIPCRLREAAFVLDGLLEHDTELDPTSRTYRRILEFYVNYDNYG